MPSDMFTIDDFINYLSELDMIEANMRDIYSAALEKSTHPHVREILRRLMEEETRHERIVKVLRQMLIIRSV